MDSTQHIDCTLSRSERLRGRNAVSTLFSDSESGFAYPLRYVWREVEGASEGERARASEGEGCVSVLFTVPKRFHKRANKRNLLRRRIKEAYRLQKSAVTSASRPLHIALIYSTKEQLSYERIARAVAAALSDISQHISERE